MRIIPFIDIPVMDIETPPVGARRSNLGAWADGDIVKISAAFICYFGEGSSMDDYVYQIGFPVDNCLVTTKQTIMEVGSLDYKVSNEVDLKEYLNLLPSIRAHINLYFDKIKCIPDWGTTKFKALRLEGKTVRYLEGPHKAGGLRPGERREVILDRKGEFAYGAIIKRTKI